MKLSSEICLVCEENKYAPPERYYVGDMIDIEFDIESRENIYNCEILNIFKDEIAIRYYRDSNYDNDDIDNIVVLYIQFEDIKSINRSEYDF